MGHHILLEGTIQDTMLDEGLLFKRGEMVEIPEHPVSKRNHSHSKCCNSSLNRACSSPSCHWMVLKTMDLSNYRYSWYCCWVTTFFSNSSLAASFFVLAQRCLGKGMCLEQEADISCHRARLWTFNLMVDMQSRACLRADACRHSEGPFVQSLTCQ